MIYRQPFAASVLVFSCEYRLKYGADKGLYEEQLREESKGEIEAHLLKPVRRQRDKGKACVIGIVQPCGDKAHGRAHKSDGSADNGGFECHRVSFLRIEHLACKSEGRRTAEGDLQRKRKGELYQDHRSCSVIRFTYPWYYVCRAFFSVRLQLLHYSKTELFFQRIFFTNFFCGRTNSS